MTFNAAHKYLGLTSEVLRTEKAINDIAVHPLPASFYESGGLEKLRQRFDHSPRSNDAGPSEMVNVLPSPRSLSQKKSGKAKTNGGSVLTGSRRRAGSEQLRFGVHSHTSSRTLVQAGDLLSTVGHPSEAFKPKSFAGLTAPRHVRRESMHSRDTDGFVNEDSPPLDDFNLKEEVMSCIAKSIGLIQPPAVGDELLESPPLPASDSGSNLFRSSYGSLSLLEMVNDGTSSVTGSSSTGEMTGLDNEVEIRFFPAGSTLIHAGERNAGLFFCFKCLVLFTQGHRNVLRDRGISGCDTPTCGLASPWGVGPETALSRKPFIWLDEQTTDTRPREQAIQATGRGKASLYGETWWYRRLSM